MCVILKRPLDKGENTTYVKFDTARKMCYCSLTRIQDVFIVQNTWKTYLMKAPTHTAQFDNFMTGYRKRVGGDSRPHLALSIQVLLHLQAKCAQRYEDAVLEEDKDETINIITFKLSEYCGSLRGDKFPKFDAARFNISYDLGRNHPTFPCIPICFLGRFKKIRE